MSAPLVVSFVLAAILGGVLLSLWWGSDNDIRDLTDRVVVMEAALNLGPEPQALVDTPISPVGVSTEPMERVDVIGGRRTRPSPHPRGRHRKETA